MKYLKLKKIPLYLMLALLTFSVFKYLSDPTGLIAGYAALGFPEWAYYFNLIAKIAGIIALAVPSVPRRIKDFARAGFLYIFLMSFLAHQIPGVGSVMLSSVALVLRILAFGLDVKKHGLN